MFLTCKEAYEFLSDPFRKLEYDQSLKPKPSKKKKSPVHHDLSFVTEKIKKMKPPVTIRRRTKKINVEKNQCGFCEGYGLVLNRFNASVRCPACYGSGRKPAFADQTLEGFENLSRKRKSESFHVEE
jgi:DnaJ-class molecular chaperone